MKKIIAIPLLSVFLLTILSGCGSSAEQQAQEKAPELIEPMGVDIDTAEAKIMDLSCIQSFQGEVVPEIKEVSFKSSGNIGKLYVSIGDKVKKGQILATLASANEQVKTKKDELKQKKQSDKEANQIMALDIKRLKEELRQLKKQYKKEKDAIKKKNIKEQMISKKEDIKIEQVKLRQKKETQELENADLQADIDEIAKSVTDAKIYSPVDGEIISLPGGEGYMVQGGNTAVTIADMENVKLRTEYLGNSTLAKASSYVAVIKGKRYEVIPEEQEISQFDIEMGNYPTSTYYTFVDKNVKLTVGDSATLDLHDASAKEALVIPTNAVYKSDEDNYVYVMKGNVKNKVSVTLGASNDAYMQILTGIKEGDVVYVQS